MTLFSILALCYSCLIISGRDGFRGVPHHLLGTISPNVEFTAKEFRDSAIPLIDEMWSRNRLPVIVGGTNYYIQALVSRFLLDDHAEDLEANGLFDHPGGNEKPDSELEPPTEDYHYSYSSLKELDPVAANRIHPNNQRKIKQYLSLCSRFGVLSSKLFQENTMEYVSQRVDLMVSAGLLEEVCDIYKSNADYTRGLRQAIGVREFEDFLSYWNSEYQQSSACHKKDMLQILESTDEDRLKIMLKEAIEKMKVNTRRLIRRQRRMLTRLQMLSGWNIHYVNVTSCTSCTSENLWDANVVGPSLNIVKSFLDRTATSEATNRDCEAIKLTQRDLWTQYVCQACGNKELRGTYEWEQHKQGRSHRKRVSRLKKSGVFSEKTIRIILWPHLNR